MGRAKERADEIAARGYYDIEKFVCTKCVNDKFLRRAINLNASSETCDYCHKKSKNKNIAASVEVIIDLILKGFEYEWENPLNELRYVSSEGGWQGEVLDNWDISEYIQDEAEIENIELLKDIRESLVDREWCKPNRASWEDTLNFSWNTFTNLIKHKYRYTFYQIPEDAYRNSCEEYISPKKILTVIGKIINTHRGLITQLSKDTEIFRVRWFEEKPNVALLTAKLLGAPPQECAVVTNRMSPSGIPLFYGALDQQTAFIETVKDEKARYCVIAKFKALRNLKILNLCSLPKMPSLFDKKNRGTRDVIRFLRKFSDNICCPIERDGREHIEYVPTQVLSEYFRYIFKYKKKKIDGILYPSSKTRGSCCSLFIENDECIDPNNNLSETYTLCLMNVIHNNE